MFSGKQRETEPSLSISPSPYSERGDHGVSQLHRGTFDCYLHKERVREREKKIREEARDYCYVDRIYPSSHCYLILRALLFEKENNRKKKGVVI